MYSEDLTFVIPFQYVVESFNTNLESQYFVENEQLFEPYYLDYF